MRVPEAAAWIGCSPSALYGAIRRGEFPHRKIGRTIWVSPKVVEQWFSTGVGA